MPSTPLSRWPTCAAAWICVASSRNWALDHAPENLGVAPYHIVLSGTCRAELSGGQCVTLEEGDILLMPGGGTHLLRSQGARIRGCSLALSTVGC